MPAAAPPPPALPVAPQATVVEPAPPDWIQEARRKYTVRFTDWAAQAWSAFHSPRRFMEDWATGRREMLNPLRFVAVGSTLSFLVDRGARTLLALSSTDLGWRSWLYTSTAGLLFVLVNSALLHLVLRSWSKAPFRSTMAAFLYSQGAATALLTGFGWLVTVTMHLVHHPARVVDAGGVPWPLPALVCAYLSMGWTVVMVAAVHRVRWWRAALAFIAIPVAFIVVPFVVAVAVAVLGS